eukprot:2334961-Pleurochrysis_carterae.AAC.1
MMNEESAKRQSAWTPCPQTAMMIVCLLGPSTHERNYEVSTVTPKACTSLAWQNRMICTVSQSSKDGADAFDANH